MPTNILRKLDIAVERKVVAAQSRTTLPSSAPWRSNCRAGCTSARMPNSTRVTLNGFMACSESLAPTIHNSGALRFGHYFGLSSLAPTIARAKKADARADRAPENDAEEHQTFRFLAMMPRAVAVRVTCSENGDRTRGPPTACGCGGDDAAPSGAGEGNGDELHCVVGFNPHKHGVLAILLGSVVAAPFAPLRPTQSTQAQRRMRANLGDLFIIGPVHGILRYAVDRASCALPQSGASKA